MKGFSSRNLKYMSFFEKLCPDAQIGQQSAAQLPWFHLVAILTKVTEPLDTNLPTIEEIEEGLSRDLESNQDKFVS